MALTPERVAQVADALETVCNSTAALHAVINQLLEYNSDQAIDWNSTTKTFTADSTTDAGTSNGHGLVAGQKVRVSSSGTLPAPLVVNTDYWLVTVATDTFKFAATLGGSVIDLTSNGTGTLTLFVVPSYLSEDASGNITNRRYSRFAVGNVISSLDWVRKLITNQVMTGSQGDHLGNLNAIAKPLN